MHRLSFLASVITLCARYMLDLPDKARQDYCHLCTRYSYSRQSLSHSLSVCALVFSQHMGCLACTTYPQLLSTHVVMNPLQAHKHCMHFPSLSTTFSASGLIPHRHTLLKPSTSAEQHLLFHFLDLCHPSVHLHTQQRQWEILGSNTLSAGRVTRWGQRGDLNIHRR